MNFTTSNIDRLQLDAVIDFQPIYNLGRSLLYNEKTKVQYFSIDDPTVSQEFVSQVIKVVESLMRLIKETETNFHPAFVELSLYDPKDRTGHIFYSLLISNIETTIGCYIEQMRKNLRRNDERGAIIPHKKIHSSAFYYYSEEKKEKESVFLKFNELSDFPGCIYIGRFDTSKTKEDNDKAELNSYILNFLEGVANNCFKTLNDAKGKYVYNSSFLIPLFRPAALFKGEQENIYNGGGIFIYGNLPNKSNEYEFVLELQSNFAKSIFKASHTHIAYDEIESFKNTFISMLIHQIKNKLTNQIAQKLSYILKNYNLENEVKELIFETKINSENIVSKFSNYLNNIGFKLSKTNKQGTKISAFCEISRSLCEKKGIKFECRQNKIISDDTAMVHPDILEMILDEFFDNAINYYENADNCALERKIIIDWKQHGEAGLISFSVISHQTLFDENEIKIYGLLPIKDTNSTGLGGFFINDILKQIEARRFSDGRYFRPENTQEGFLIEMNFNIHKEEDGN